MTIIKKSIMTSKYYYENTKVNNKIYKCLSLTSDIKSLGWSELQEEQGTHPAGHEVMGAHQSLDHWSPQPVHSASCSLVICYSLTPAGIPQPPCVSSPQLNQPKGIKSCCYTNKKIILTSSIFLFFCHIILHFIPHIGNSQLLFFVL